MATNDLAPVGAGDDVAQGLPAATLGQSSSRRLVGLVGQYLGLSALAALVLGPIALTVVQALSPQAQYFNAGTPPYPVHVRWLDRTWFTGGPFSVVVRTLLVLAFLVWLQRVASGAAPRRPAPRWAPPTQVWAPCVAVATVAVLWALAGLPSGAVLILWWAAVVVAGAGIAWLLAAQSVPLARSVWERPGPVGLASAVAGTVALAVLLGPTFGSLRDADGRSQWWALGTALLVAATQLPGYLDARRRPTWVAGLISVTTGLLLTAIAVVIVGPEVWGKAWGQYSLGEAMGRSLTMAVLITVLQVGTSIMAAYAFVFLDFPLKNVLFALFMATLLLPLEVTLVGNIETIRSLEWIDSMQALVLPFGAAALGTFLIRQGFRGLPSEIQDATRLDGYGHVAFLTKFAVPLTRPVIASFTVISALSAWNQYLWPRSVIESNSFNTLQIQLKLKAAGEVQMANQAIAAALVAAVPVAIALVLFQRQIIRGLTAGAVK